MSNIPLEVLRRFGSFLEQKQHLECSIVCKPWRKAFQPLVFQTAIFKEDWQIIKYVDQNPSLRRLTTSFWFRETTVDIDEFEDIVKPSPQVHSLRTEFDELDSDDALRTAYIIRRHWSTNLVKIEVEPDFLKVLLPLLNHQLQDVDGRVDAFFSNAGRLIPMPQFKVLKISCFLLDNNEYDLKKMSLKRLNDMRVAYPKLEELTLSDFIFEPAEDDSFSYIPFPFVQSSTLSDECTEHTDYFPRWSKMFTGLKEYYNFSFRFDYSSKLRSNDPYSDFLTANPALSVIWMQYLGGMARADGFPNLQKLINLTKLDLHGIKSTDIVTKRELLGFDLLMSSVPNITLLRINGIFHFLTGESVENYLSGTVGYCDTGFETYMDSDNTIVPIIQYANKINVSRNSLAFGDGESLCKFNTLITTVKKKTPQLKQSEPTLIYTWDEERPNHFRIFDPPKTTITSYLLTILILLNVTLKNSTYRWIAHNLPLLEGFYVNYTEPYPFREIHLGEEIDRFLISFDKRYKSYGVPITRLIDHNSKKERTIAWAPERDAFKTIQPLEEIGLFTYAITINYRSMPSYFTVCDHDALSVLRDIKKWIKLCCA